jgi:hypothetical protein
MPISRLRPLEHAARAASLIDVVELSLEALAADLAVLHHPLADNGDKRLPSVWLAPVLSGHLDALRHALATYRDARIFEEDERLF